MLATNIALSFGASAILHAVAGGSRFGFDIMQSTGLTSGTVYPTLERLEAAGDLKSKWEAPEEAHAAGRPARRPFPVAAPGANALRAAPAEDPALRPRSG